MMLASPSLLRSKDFGETILQADGHLASPRKESLQNFASAGKTRSQGWRS
jgi:hypothetical protein